MTPITIDPHGDLILEVVRRETNRATGYVPQQAERLQNPILIASFLINKSVLISCPTAWANHVHNVFKNMLLGAFRETRQNVITLEGDNEVAMAVFLRVIHNIDVPLTLSEDHEVVWPLVAILDKYNISIDPFKVWFAEWYKYQGDAIRDIKVQEMLYPCWKLDHAEGFLLATHTTVYNLERRVHDINPTNYRRFHLPLRIVQQLNAARGRLRTTLHRELFRKGIKDTYEGIRVECKKNAEYAFHRGLYNTGAWPLEDTWLKESPIVVLNRLSSFKDVNHERCTNQRCTWCIRDYKKIVEDARKATLRLFDGLCLDCLENPIPNRRLELEDRRMDGDDWDTRKWDLNCRVEHGESTSYYSTMGRRHVD